MMPKAHIEVAHATNLGLVRERNEDQFAWFSTIAGELILVADGMGGCNGGCEAAQCAIQTFRDTVEKSANIATDLLLKEALFSSDRAVLELGENNLDFDGCGTTIVALLIRGNKAYYIHAGDSRLYLFSNGNLRQLTRDHSETQDMLESGKISIQEANERPKNVITQSLGGNIDPKRINVSSILLKNGDIFLLCTDGLWGVVPDVKIKQILESSPKFTNTPKSLIEYALGAGGPDNVTVQLVSYNSSSMDVAHDGKAQLIFQKESAKTGNKTSASLGNNAKYYPLNFPLVKILLSIFIILAIVSCGIYYKFIYKNERSLSASIKVHNTDKQTPEQDQGVSDILLNKIKQYNDLSKHEKYPEALKYFTELESIISADKLLYLGKIYLKGEYGVAIDFSLALEFLKKASDKGNIEACYLLGDMYYMGFGASRDLASAENFYKIAAKQGHMLAMLTLAKIFEDKNQIRSSFEYYKQAADKGSAEAQYKVGRIYCDELGAKDIIDQDQVLGIDYLNRAAKQGHHSAQKYLELIINREHLKSIRPLP
jgi:protein phosphatase